jgi:hypothetical protein
MAIPLSIVLRPEFLQSITFRKVNLIPS